MNHDATHCLDYEPNKCPKRCYRAELTEDLRHRPDLIGLTFSWTHYAGTEECKRKVIE